MLSSPLSNAGFDGKYCANIKKGKSEKRKDFKWLRFEDEPEAGFLSWSSFMDDRNVKKSGEFLSNR